MQLARKPVLSRAVVAFFAGLAAGHAHGAAAAQPEAQPAGVLA